MAGYDITPGGITKEPESIRAEILRLASEAVLKDRNRSYGGPERSFDNISHLWNSYLSIRYENTIKPLTPMDVGILLQLLKIARISTNPTHKDSHVDNVGYAACAAECALGDKS